MGGVVESWPWFHIMDEAMQGRLYNSNLVLSPETAGNAGHRGNCQPNQNQENTDILEFLIKTEMEDTVAAETAADDGGVHTEAPPPEGIPMGWRRMTECSYKSRQTHLADIIRYNHTSRRIECLMAPPHPPPLVDSERTRNREDDQTSSSQRGALHWQETFSQAGLEVSRTHLNQV